MDRLAVMVVVTAAPAQQVLFLARLSLMLVEAVAAVTVMQPQEQAEQVVVETVAHLPTLLVPPVQQTPEVAAALVGITQ